jgi:group II intron reverse transcriptase/maturase
MAKGSRFPHGEDAKVREMRTAETILNIIQDRGKRKLPLDDVYRQLYNPAMSLRSYAKLYPNDGAMTPGMTEETVDGWSMEKVAAIIVAIRDERWQWTPVKRVLIDKPKGGKRPLGLPVWSDKVVQDIIRSILEAYYEPQFSKHSHGFRPKRGCHTALKEIDEVWQGTKWFIEGDIKGCFDNIDHTLLMNILRENIHDNRFLRLIEGALKAGYCEEWKYHPSLSGSPQGGIVSPILSNIYMDRLDRFVQDTVIPEYTRGTRRKEGEEYRRLHSLSTYYRNTGRIERAEELRKAMQQYPSVDPNDEEYRRLRYVRYADDFLLGYAGTLAEATEIKEKIAAFLRTQLNLTLSADKTLITHASTGRARFLGYEIGTMYCQTKFDKLRKRAVNGKIGLYIPEDVLQKKRQRYLRDGKVHHRTELMNDSEYDIIIRYQAEYRGLVQYYTLAQNRCRLGYVGFTMETSLLKTLASKGRTTFAKTLKRLKSTTQSPHGPRTCLKLTIERAGQRPLVAIFGGLSLRRKQTAIKDQVLMPYIRRRSEIVERLLNNTCEVCGSKEHIQMHHVRHLADLNKQGRREKPLWMKIMIARKRKSIPLCKRCHDDVHFNRPTFRKTRRLESRVP